jgi:hypothetical protein
LVGLQTYQRLESTIEKYPDYFPWEYIYNSIPLEVHNNYIKQEKLLFLSFYPLKEYALKDGEGLYSWLKRQEPIPIKITKQDLQKLANQVFVTAPKIKTEYETEKVKLWNKHYKKYKLKYRE